MIKKSLAALVCTAAFLLIGFQNCSKAKFSRAPDAVGPTCASGFNCPQPRSCDNYSLLKLDTIYLPVGVNNTNWVFKIRPGNSQSPYAWTVSTPGSAQQSGSVGAQTPGSEFYEFTANLALNKDYTVEAQSAQSACSDSFVVRVRTEVSCTTPGAVLAFTTSPASTSTLLVGQLLTVTLTNRDPAVHKNIQISWEDGGAFENYGIPGNANVSTHTYNSDGPKRITIRWTNGCNQQQNLSFEVNPINEQNPSNLKASLVVRATACLSCHSPQSSGVIRSNVVTDFGYPDNFFGNNRNQTLKYAVDINGQITGYNHAALASKYSAWGPTTLSSKPVLGNLYIPKELGTHVPIDIPNEVNLERIHEDILISERLGGGNGTPKLKELITGLLKSWNTSTIHSAACPGGVCDVQGGVYMCNGGACNSHLVDVRIAKVTNSTDEHQPGIHGQVIEAKSMKIRAPTEAEMRSIKTATNLVGSAIGNQAQGVAAYRLKLNNSSDLPIFNVANDAAHFRGTSPNKYLKLFGNVECQGDILIDGVLVLKDVNLITNGKSCRLYVTKSVFVQGAITGLEGNNLSNLQISSSRAIIVGFRHVEDRLNRSGILHGIGTKNKQDCPDRYADRKDLRCNLEEIQHYRDTVIADKNNTLAADVENDAGPVQVIRMKATGQVLAHRSSYPTTRLCGPPVNPGDPVCPGDAESLWGTGSYPWTWVQPPRNDCVEAESCTNCVCNTGWAAEYQRKTVSYHKVVFNAPVVHNRYYGKFEGIIIAEDALFSLGQFDFDYDETFNDPSIQVLPLAIHNIFNLEL